MFNSNIISNFTSLNKRTKVDMKRFYVEYDKRVLGDFVWANSKREARKQMTAYAKHCGFKIISVTE